MNEQGKVSMVVPCYNKKDYIGAMLESVLAQVWDNIELILVNDGSTDGTREIISAYEPKLKARGYDLIIVDQENQGCCAAVYNGMLRITGDYFCLVDCDDEIMPEYVSRMAGWLDENDEYEWAACHFKRVVKNGDEQKTEHFPVSISPETPKMLENWLLWRITAMVWIYMMRVSYVKKCKLIENFCSDRHVTYEPCIVIPPAASGGRIKFFDEPLYVYNKYASDLSGFPTFDKMLDYYSEYLYLSQWAINRLDTTAEAKKRYLAEAMITFNFRYTAYNDIPDSISYRLPLAEKIASVIDDNFSPQPRIQACDILAVGFSPLYEIIKDVFLDSDSELRDRFTRAKRIIGYGALGKFGQKDLPLIKDTWLCPTVLWDNEADECEFPCVIPLRKPDFDSLSPDDLVIVFPRSERVLTELRPLLKNTKAGAVLYHSDLSTLYWKASLFPKLLNCKYNNHVSAN